ncbi:periplasmic heavy metal sensor [Nitratidesulfovibrio sp.]|uniref:periplasmic heavy metal sensor n=1 Tax=Nitratidesulfovibrio sp. TaxID=2802297 RepID=UPI00333EBD1C
MSWEFAVGVVAVKATVLCVLWYNRRRIAARLAGVDMRRVARTVARELELAPDEARQLARRLDAHERTLDELRRHNTALRQRLHAVIRDGAMAPDALDALFAEKRQLAEQAYANARDAFVQFHAGLSPAQRDRLAGLLDRHAAHPLFRHPLLP